MAPHQRRDGGPRPSLSFDGLADPRWRARKGHPAAHQRGRGKVAAAKVRHHDNAGQRRAARERSHAARRELHPGDYLPFFLSGACVSTDAASVFACAGVGCLISPERTFEAREATGGVVFSFFAIGACPSLGLDVVTVPGERRPCLVAPATNVWRGTTPEGGVGALTLRFCGTPASSCYGGGRGSSVVAENTTAPAFACCGPSCCVISGTPVRCAASRRAAAHSRRPLSRHARPSTSRASVPTFSSRQLFSCPCGVAVRVRLLPGRRELNPHSPASEIDSTSIASTISATKGALRLTTLGFSLFTREAVAARSAR